MTDHSGYIRPRVRRAEWISKVPHSPANSAAERVLIRLPEISAASASSNAGDTSGALVGTFKTTLNQAKTESTKNSSPAGKVVVEPLRADPNRLARIDAAHTVPSGPHAI